MNSNKFLQQTFGLTLVVLLLAGCSGTPTTGSVEGTAFRSDTGEIYAGAEVELWAPGGDDRFSVTTMTDEQGSYSFADLEPGEYFVSVSVEVGSIGNSPCQEFTSVGGLPTTVYKIGEQGFMGWLLPDGKLLVQIAGESLNLSAGDVIQVDFDLYCHNE